MPLDRVDQQKIYIMTSGEIRQQFLDFFKSKGHHIVPSAPIVIKNDPSLLFTNAGMNQFKDYFLGNKKVQYPRIADTQKCLRVSGKHNDLEEVGVDTYHHTMFEMLGNWSFGDPARPADGYFKKEAIAWSWELLTDVYKFDKDRLYVTIFEGDEKENLPEDEEAVNEWKKWIDESRIIAGKKKDNFWEMGDTGPCGPCTEIHYDSRSEEERKKVDGKTLVNNEHPQVIEIWNLVFIQFNRLRDGSLELLPAKHVDTGMGFERLTRVLQDKHSNYDTDIFSGTIAEIERITGNKYVSDPSSLIKDYENEIGFNSEDLEKIQAITEKSRELGILNIAREAIAFRVIADHIRAICFTIADGQLPSNTGAGYVIRRILRRAVRYYYSYLNYKQPLLHQLVPIISKQFSTVFPELQNQIEFVTKVVKEEEDAFLRTLEIGLRRIQMMIDAANFNYHEEIKRLGYGSTTSKKETPIPPNEILEKISKTYKIIDGKSAFELYDTYGFPLDLTKLIVKGSGLTVDEAGFEKEMEQQKQRSRAATAIDTEDWVVLDDYALNEFVGYDSLEIKTKVVKYRKVKAKGKEAYQIVLEATPFYAESGGQVGDTGKLFFDGETISVTDAKKENELIIHFTRQLPKDISLPVRAVVDAGRRQEIASNHTATHLIHAALRKVLGAHVQQKGSLVNDEHLRFDFSHFAKMTDEEIRAVELMVNDKIRENIPVQITYLKKEEAIAKGATAFFGEKYGDIVRVVTIDPAFSMELCGGTHVYYTGMIGTCKILSETATAAGVRRIEAITGVKAQNFFYDQLKEIKEIAAILKTSDPVKSLHQLIDEKNLLEKKVERLENKLLLQTRQQLLNKVQTIDGVNFIGEVVDISNADLLKKLCFDLKTSLTNYFVVLTANIEGKANVAVLLDDTVAASKNLEAQKIIKEQVAPLIKGGGGGQKTLATAGGKDASNLHQVIEKVKSLL